MRLHGRYLVGNDSRTANVQTLLNYLQSAKLGKPGRQGRPSKKAQIDSRACHFSVAPDAIAQGTLADHGFPPCVHRKLNPRRLRQMYSHAAVGGQCIRSDDGTELPVYRS